MKRDLIVFGEDWGALPSSTQHLIKQLRRDRKVLWINSIGLRRPKLCGRDIQRAVRKLSEKRHCKAPQQNKAESSHFQSHTLLTLPAPRSRLARRLSRNLMAAQLRKHMDAMQLNEPILWTSLPTAGDLKHAFPTLPMVYYCGDDFSALAGVDHHCVAQHEQRLVANADIILAASERLYEKFPQSKTQLLSHGVDFELFSEAQARAADLPDNGRPTAGFYGSLSEWLDMDLLVNAARLSPQWNFVFIGEEKVCLQRLKALPNTYFLGPKPHAHLPRYSQHWQASLLPFKHNAQIEACNPLKLKEYLAAGTPIIATEFPALSPYRAAINVVANPLQLREALNTLHHFANLSTLDKRDSARALVRGDSWLAKANLVERWLERL